MALPPALQTVADGLGKLLPWLLARDGDALVLSDPGSGEWLWIGEPMAAWLGAASLDARALAERLGGAAATLRAAEAAVADDDAAVSAIATEHKLEVGGERKEFGVWRARVVGPDGTLRVVSVWRDRGPARGREALLRTALAQLEQQQQANERLRQESQGPSPRDGASGLYHRAHFEDQLRREVDLSTREHREFALVAIEIDAPAAGAAARGAEARERIVQAMGRLLRGNTRAMDASCRDGDNRFAVLLSGVGLATAHSRMEGLRRQCATQIVALEGREIGFTVSMGVASFPHTAQSQDDLFSACEAALVEARQRGGNRVTLASISFEQDG
jgi:diguanylate cyclase (GGDEF)-like protein